MKKLFIFAAVFLFAAGIFSVSAQDLIILVDGNMIEAKVMEISPSEIRYRRFDNLDGPLIVIPSANVMSIRFENGIVEVINTAPPVAAETAQAAEPKAAIVDPNKLYIGISAEPAGFLISGPSLSAEISKGKFNSLIRISIPSLGLNSKTDGFGFGLGAAVNYFWPRRIGGFYLGGLFDWNIYPYPYTYYHPYDTYNPSSDTYTGKTIIDKVTVNDFVIAINFGYKFFTKFGMYFRTGVSFGPVFSTRPGLKRPIQEEPYFKPDVSFGYSF